MLEFQSKTALRKKFGVNGGVEWGFLDTPKTPKNRENAQKLMFLDTPKISLIYAIGSKLFQWELFYCNSNIYPTARISDIKASL